MKHILIIPLFLSCWMGTLQAQQTQLSLLPDIKRLPLGNGGILDDVIVMGYPNVPGFHELIAVEGATISSRITATKGNIASSGTVV